MKDKQILKMDVYFVTNEIPYREAFVTLEANKEDVDHFIPCGAAKWEEIKECEWKHQLYLAAFGLFKKNDPLPTSNHWHIFAVEISDE